MNGRTVTGRTYTRTRPRGLAPWNPQRQTRALLVQVSDVLAEYRAYLPMTARQVFYRLVGAYGYDKAESAYDRLLGVLNRGRRAGLVSWEALRDVGATVLAERHFDDLADFWGAVQATAERYRTDRQAGQASYIEVWCEAAGMAPQLARVAGPFSVPVYSSGGFDSVTLKYEAAGRFIRRQGQLTTVLHVGDLDPSGCSIVDSAAGDVGALCRDRGFGGVVTFVRLAVTDEHVQSYNLPTAPPKSTDRRGERMAYTVQAEALDPATLAALVQRAIEERLDLDTYHDLLALESDERAGLIDDVAAMLDDQGGKP